ncbi:unnamed protein product [Rotaria magnacalcarata]
MFFPVATIEDLPHILLYYNFSQRQNRYFLSPYGVEICKQGSPRTVCDVIRSSNFLCAVLDIDRLTILKVTSTNLTSTTMENSSEQNKSEKPSRCALSCSATQGNNDSHDILLEIIEQRLDFKHRFSALDVDHSSSVLCNSIGYPNLMIDDEYTSEKSTNKVDNNTNTQAHKIRHQHRQYVHQWICIQDIVNDLITCNHTLKSKSISEILIKMDLWLKQRLESKNQQIKNDVRFPRRSHGRISNFRYCELAAENVTCLDCFKRAHVIKINSSLAQEPLRYLTLCYNKVLLMPTPTFESALFYKLDPKFLRQNQFKFAATKPGAAELGTIVQLSALKLIHVDVVVVASVVVNSITGARIVDIIVTPKRYIYTKRSFQRPACVYWNKIDPDIMSNIPVLQESKQLEQQDNATQ